MTDTDHSTSENSLFRPMRVGGLRGRPVQITGVGLACPAGIGAEGAEGGRPGAVPGFRPRAYVSDRKSLKLMSRSVQLGVSVIQLALSQDPTWESVAPERRGCFVGASPQPGDPDDLRMALEAAMVPGDTGPALSLSKFATEGMRLIHPLWLVKGLSNNVLGFASAIHNLQGVNANYCDGQLGGWTALREGAMAVAEGRADLVVAGASDSLVQVASLLGGVRCGEGAAFVVFRAIDPSDAVALEETQVLANRETLMLEPHLLGELGAATFPVSLVRQLLRHTPSLME